MFFSKKSQIKFAETIGVIIIVYIILMIGLIWYNNVNTKQLNQINQINNQDLAFEKYYYIVNADFLHFSQKNDIDEEFDLVALESIYDYSENLGEKFLYSKLKNSLIKVKIYENIGYDLTFIKEIVLYNKSIKKTNLKSIQNFNTLIPIIDSINQKTLIGFLEVKVYN